MNETEDTTRDAFLGGRVYVTQPANGFRSGLDAVFLAAACPARRGEQIVEAGCGAGAASLCLLARVPELIITGIDADAGLASLAAANATGNGFDGRFQSITADVREAWSTLEGLGLRQEAYDHVIANPPFYTHGRTRLPRDARKSRSRVMDEGGLDSWMRFCAACARPEGTATLIHTAAALNTVLEAFERRFGGVTVLPVYPNAVARANRIIVQGIKGSRAPLAILPGIVVHEIDGTLTPQAASILREGQGLFCHSPS